MRDDDLNDRLEGWGGETTPDVDPRFANSLETDLRLRAAEVSSRGGLFHLLFRPAVIAGVTMAAVVGFLFVRSGEDAVDVFIAAAEGTSVSIPGDAELTDGVAGLDLPEGSRIDVGPDGSATVAGVVLEAGTTARIVDGQLEIVDVPSDRPPDRPTTTIGDRPTTTIGPTADSDEPAATDGPATTAPSDVPPTTRPDDTASTTTRPTTTTPATTIVPDTAPQTTSTEPPRTEPTDRNVDVKLDVGRVREQQSLLRWEVAGSVDAIAGWEVRVRSGDGVRRVALIREPDARRLRVEIPGRNAMYKVIARAADGTNIGESEWVRLPVGDG